eukprot:symbB.v1.2.000315.t1/scaffold6.1/size569917/18
MQIWSRPKSLKPKLRFATEVMGLTVQKVLGSKTPFFRLSMLKTVAPRHFFALQQQKPGPTIFQNFSLCVFHLLPRFGRDASVAVFLCEPANLAAMAVLAKMASYYPMSSWPLTFLACSGGFSNILYSFGLGYGLSMTANAGLAPLVAKLEKRTLTPFAWACCGLYAAYGVRLTSFLMRRQEEESYKPRFELLQLKSDMMDLGSKLAIVMGVSFSQALYALPLAVATSSSPVRAPPVLKAVGWAGVGLAGLGLLIESAERFLGIVSTSRRHPNYFGEFLFHCGISCMGITGTPIQVAACVFPTFFMAFTLKNSAARSDKEADHRYRNCDGYTQWAQTTPLLIPGLL